MNELAQAIRTLIGDDPNVSEKRMFGGICFMLNNHMLCGASGTGQYLLRVGKDEYETLLQEADAAQMDFTGRVMKGYVYVEPGTLERLKWWLGHATDFVTTLPPKPAKIKK